eukprot:763018-Hanusia_phi.AAC.3
MIEWNLKETFAATIGRSLVWHQQQHHNGTLTPPQLTVVASVAVTISDRHAFNRGDLFLRARGVHRRLVACMHGNC